MPEGRRRARPVSRGTALRRAVASVMARAKVTARDGARAVALGDTYFPPQQADGFPTPRGSHGSTSSGRGAGTKARAIRRLDNPSSGVQRASQNGVGCAIRVLLDGPEVR